MVKEKLPSPVLSRIRVVKIEEKGFDFPLSCFHCENAPCMNSCPTGAIEREDTGAVIIKDELCIGCKLCFLACPFGAISIRENMPVKCDLCHGKPFCAEICPSDAIKYGSEIKESSKKRFEFVESIISEFRVVE